MYVQFSFCVQGISIQLFSVDQVNLILKLIGSSFFHIQKSIIKAKVFWI